MRFTYLAALKHSQEDLRVTGSLPLTSRVLCILCKCMPDFLCAGHTQQG